MSAHYVVLAVFILLMALVPFKHAQYIEEDDGGDVSNYPYENCVRNTGCPIQEGPVNIIIVSTLNGSLTALDGETGDFLWKYNDDPLLQGTLSTSGPIEIAGTSLQLMPTLDGRLFSYAHQMNLIEPLPITTESLLESTVRLGRDAVAGGKSVSTVGIDVVTGNIKYKCSLDACAHSEDSNQPQNPTLLVKRISNSIRAMDSVRGIERWNLSTAELELSIAGYSVMDEKTTSKILLRPPDGVITSLGRFDDIEWSTSVGGHIVNVWQVTGTSIQEISLFDPGNIYTTQIEVGHREARNMQAQSSLFYMGTSDGYPFIIQSKKAKQNLKKNMADLTDFGIVGELTGPSLCSANPVTRGLAYEVEDTALLVVLKEAFGKSHSKAIEDKSTKRVRDTRGELRIIAHNDDPQVKKSCIGTRTPGVALIGTDNLRSTSLSRGGDYGYLVLDSQSCAPPAIAPPLPIKVMQNFSSLVTGIVALLTTTVFGVVWKFWPYKRTPKAIEAPPPSPTDCSSRSSNRTRNVTVSTTTEEFIIDQDSSIDNAAALEVFQDEIVAVKSPLKTSVSVGPPAKKTPLSEIRKKNKSEVRIESDIDEDDNLSMGENEKKRLLRSRTISRSSLEGFVSRFANEFEVQKVIGHGGFGVVFRAQSITDMNEYAVKRIAVADNEKARNRVLREARALAMFDHPGIIRYFYAWEERPPKGFQEKEDETVLGKMRAMKLKKLHAVKKGKKLLDRVSQIKSAEMTSFADSFEMPPVVGNTVEDSWSADDKPQKIDHLRTTSESKRGFGMDGHESGSIAAESSGLSFANESVDNSSSSSSSSDDEEEPSCKPCSSSGGIEFKNDSENVAPNKNELDVIVEEEMSLKNRVMIVETENNELEVRETNMHGDCAYLYIVMQLCDERTLEDWIRKNKTPESRSLETMKHWIRQLAESLEYLHGKGFIHRDLKPGNVFFSLESKPNRKILKIGDLGLATKTDGASRLSTDSSSSISDQKHTRNVGTRSYMSPEQLSHQRYTEKVDIFALGLVATELIIPFSTAMERMHTFSAFQKGIEPEILKDHPQSREFLMQLTSLNPDERPTAQEVASHPFLK